MANPDLVEIYTDGACKGNPGPGGWGALLRCKNVEKTFHGGEANTTNNRMELMAAISGLSALSRRCDVILITDSNYVKNGIEQWITNWKKNGWRTADKKPVKNADLWQRLDQLVNEHNVQWRWVKGHSGHRENDIADELANLGASEYM